MKKLIIISVLFTVFVNCFSQPRIIGLTSSPLSPSIGTYYVSKPIFQISKFYIPTSLFSSIEYAKNKYVDVDLLKFAIGPSVIIPNFLHFSTGETKDLQIYFGISFNAVLNENPDDYIELSFETGLTIPLNKIINISFLIDPPNNHFKFGVALGF